MAVLRWPIFETCQLRICCEVSNTKEIDWKAGGGAILDSGLRTIFQIWNSSLARRQKVIEERNYLCQAKKIPPCVLVNYWTKEKRAINSRNWPFCVVFPAFLLIALFFNGLVREANRQTFCNVLYRLFSPLQLFDIGATKLEPWKNENQSWLS